MHETHPGFQDMACECDTFLKIVQKCKQKFVLVKVGESEPFVSQLLKGLPTTTMDLQPHQIHTFYESVAQIIQVEPNPNQICYGCKETGERTLSTHQRFHPSLPFPFPTTLSPYPLLQICATRVLVSTLAYMLLNLLCRNGLTILAKHVKV